MDQPQPKFFLEKELILFLQQNMTLQTGLLKIMDGSEGAEGKRSTLKAWTNIFINGELITASPISEVVTYEPGTKSLVGIMTPIQMESHIKQLEHDVRDLTFHMLEMQNKLDSMQVAQNAS